MSDRLIVEMANVLAILSDVPGIEQPIRDGLLGSPDAIETILRHMNAGCYTIVLDKAIEYINLLCLSPQQRALAETLERWSRAWGAATLRGIGQNLLDNLDVDEERLRGKHGA